jgi:cytochrome P450
MTTKHPPQHPSMLFGLNNILGFYRSPLGFLSQLDSKYAGICQVKIGKQAITLVSDPRMVGQVLIEEPENFPKWRLHDEILAQYLDYDLGNESFDSNFYKTQRRIVQPAFHAKAIGSYIENIVHETFKAARVWTTDTQYDIVKQCTDLTLQVIAKVLFRLDVSDKLDAINSEVARIQTLVGREILNYFVLPRGLGKPTKRPKLTTLNALTDEALRSHLGPNLLGNDLLSMMLGALSQNNEVLDPHLARNILLMLLVSAYDTTATVLSSLISLISAYPAVEQRMLAEITSVIGNCPVESANLPQLSYTDMVIKEVLRLNPPVWLILREAAQTCDIGGFTVEEGSLLILSPYVTQRNTALFKHPTQFDPERFSPETAESMPRYSYFPFGLGAHYCIGQPLATTTLKVMLATLLPRFQWSQQGSYTMDMGDKLFHSKRYIQRMWLNRRSLN